ncbi:hypothetical protein SAMN05216557_102465 [Sphingomonas carotinifaciens]|uniref:Uncharacterized protein n=2 Tax=Sphingomonas carotinifaciens TaxID=1166323 RepID=A0A1G7J1Y1_9SPHN|nr:hypothetical protein SAMN05216557_102465 [Sphingomonas carotinifaciens]
MTIFVAVRRFRMPASLTAPMGLTRPSMTRDDLLDILLSTLVKQVGGTRRRWRIVLGDVRVYSAETHPHCNWSLAPAGTAGENAAVERTLDDLRGRHPIVT